MGGYFLEEVRRELIGKFGETDDAGPYSVYDGVLWLRTSINPHYQRYAEQALRDGLTRYDAGKGWRGPITKIEAGEGWAQRLAALNLGAGYPDWRIALVLGKSGGAAQIGFGDGSTASLPASAAAMPRRGTATAAFNMMRTGDVIVVKRDGASYALRSIPEVSGGMVVQDPRTGRVLAMQGGFDVRLASYNRATQAKRQPGSSFKPFVYAAALDGGMTPADIITHLATVMRKLLGKSTLRMTCVAAQINFEAGALAICNAGHTFPLLLRQSAGVGTKAEALSKLQQNMLGGDDRLDRPRHGYENATYEIGKSDLLVFYTDGLTEARSKDGRGFYRPFQRQFAKISSKRSSAALRDEILSQFRSHTSDVPVADDICLMVIGHRADGVEEAA
jgi:hypothetical protein